MAGPVTGGVSGVIVIKADPAWGWCAGLRHPPRAEYPAGAFTPSQLDALRADPALTVEIVEFDGASPGGDQSPGGGGAPANGPGGKADASPAPAPADGTAPAETAPAEGSPTAGAPIARDPGIGESRPAADLGGPAERGSPPADEAPKAGRRRARA